MSVPDKVTEAAKKHFAEHFGEEEHVVARTASDRHPADGRAIHLFMAVRSGVANDNAVELILDDDAHPVQLERRRHALFVPDVEPVPLEVTEAVTVKVNPAVNNLRLGECDTVREKITVTIPASAAVAPADIYFLADNTGSMGAVIAAVQAGANAIFAGLGPLTGLQFGVGEYRDFDNPGDQSLAFQNLQPITASAAAVTTAIGTWSASGGGDLPEAQFYALDQVAGSPAIGWRPGVKHIIVWLGDAPGHDPICAAASGLSYNITEASVTAKLVADQITVLAVSVFDGSADPNGLNDDPTDLGGPLNAAYGACGAPGGTPGQATRIAAATGGVVVTGVDPSAVVATIIAELKALLTIGNVHLQPVGAIAPFVTSIIPPSYGPLPGNQVKRPGLRGHVQRRRGGMLRPRQGLHGRNRRRGGRQRGGRQADAHNRTGLQVHVCGQVRLRHAGRRLRLRVRPSASGYLRDRDQHPQPEMQGSHHREARGSPGVCRCRHRPRARRRECPRHREDRPAVRRGNHG